MLQPPNKTALKGQDNLGGLSRRFTRPPISPDFTMVRSNKMRNRSPNKVRICSEEAFIDSYVCSGYIFPHCSNTLGRVDITMTKSGKLVEPNGTGAIGVLGIAGFVK